MLEGVLFRAQAQHRIGYRYVRGASLARRRGAAPIDVSAAVGDVAGGPSGVEDRARFG